MGTVRLNQAGLSASLLTIAGWFRRWTNPATCRLHYALSYQYGWLDERTSPIRDIGSAADLAVLQKHLRCREFDEVIGSTLAHFESMLVHRTEAPAQQDGKEDSQQHWCYLKAGPQGLGEPSSVAHSAMMLLALLAWEGHPCEGRRHGLMAELAAGLLHQQHPDGSFKIYFEPERLPDSGWQLYGGEAAYALGAACGCLGDDRLLHAAQRALAAYCEKYEQARVDPEELVFFANWQCQAGAAVHCQLAPGPERRHLAAYLHGLQDRIVASGFYQALRHSPCDQATVEVACALEGLAHCLQVSLADEVAAREAAASGREGADEDAAAEEKRQQQYMYCAKVAADWLLDAQVAAGQGVPQEAVGGFGHALRGGSGQRVDVTGHVTCAFVKLLQLEQALELPEP